MLAVLSQHMEEEWEDREFQASRASGQQGLIGMILSGGRKKEESA